MMDLGKPQRLAKFEVPGIMYYGNIRELVFKIWDIPKWGNTLLFEETDFTVGFADPMFRIRCATVVELRLQQMGDFYEEAHFTMENFKFREVCSKITKGTPLRQIWSNKSFGVCGIDVVLTLYGGEKKSTRESPLETRCRL